MTPAKLVASSGTMTNIATHITAPLNWSSFVSFPVNLVAFWE